MTRIAEVALEWWRASGPRTRQRLLELVEGTAATSGESAFVEHHKAVALAAVRTFDNMEE